MTPELAPGGVALDQARTSTDSSALAEDPAITVKPINNKRRRKILNAYKAHEVLAPKYTKRKL
jgi:hypothetical protein